MPYINSKVTVKLSKEQEETIKKKLGKAIELIPGKSENWLMLGFEDENSLYFRGQAFEKIAYVEVKLYGKADNAAYDQLTAAICKIFEEVLQIPSNQIYITYQEVGTWGHNGVNL